MLFRRLRSTDIPTSGALGPLERRLLDALWRRDAPASVRDLMPGFPGLAYTTLMTTLDRLWRKQALARTKSGRAFVYAPRLTRTAFEAARATDALRTTLESGGGSLAPIVSCLIDAAGDRDDELLKELELLVRARRQDEKGGRS